MSDSPPPLISNTAKVEALIRMLTLLIKIGKYLPWIVLAFASLNLILAVLDFTWWNNIAGGIFNSILAFAGFFFFAQLLGRRKIHRYEYRYSGKHSRRMKEDEERLRRSRETAAA